MHPCGFGNYDMNYPFWIYKTSGECLTSETYVILTEWSPSSTTEESPGIRAFWLECPGDPSLFLRLRYAPLRM